jgi:hypothetical protein
MRTIAGQQRPASEMRGSVVAEGDLRAASGPLGSPAASGDECDRDGDDRPEGHQQVPGSIDG